jgi:hypothetical protein
MLQIRNSDSKNTPVGWTHKGENKWYQIRTNSFGSNKKVSCEDTGYEKKDITEDI